MKKRKWWQEDPIRVLSRQEVLEIQGIWDAVEGAEPEISTERLFAMVEDIYNKGRLEQDWIDAGDISEAMDPTSPSNVRNKFQEMLHDEEI